jgi:hypothetical protein
MEQNGVKFNSYGAENLDLIDDDGGDGSKGGVSADAKEALRSGAESIAARRSKITASEVPESTDDNNPEEDGHSKTANKQTICHIFNDHLLYAFMELRYLRIREYRAVLLEYLNYFRSIEKRITMDMISFDEFESSSFEPVKKINKKMKSQDIETISSGNPMKFGKE